MKTQKTYPQGLLGKKVGMTQVYDKAGNLVPVTVLEMGPCTVLAVKDSSKHGYSAVQLGFGTKKATLCTKAENGHFGKAGKGAFQHAKEVRCDVEKLGWNTVGKEIKVSDVFTNVEMVDVCGISKGRGFAGVVKKYKMKGQPATRGTHEYRRHVGAVGCRKWPHHIFKNKRMPGHMGTDNVTVHNLAVVEVRADDNLLLVRGGVPGPNGGLVVVKLAVKNIVPAVAA